ncbi:UvrD-helicase domain-containing protein [Hymenobacter psychrophilus]|uniref:DNA 3'-5' helicase n=1 Tax=Hymenobacter psychrophilus TaxID=651662 RepID=A0A1H3BX90_9BACT|nr:UvrD-helicase domain-containing protein [Hymenobacter psychrophilus]SDX46014.1 ATP-dependent exoDNAse (exonuclease V) beta subunit (contains helicase and exonuclease domains) [Hymenobacter psychrophilus]
MSQPTFRIYSSSAGSGKTYQLTKEYLKLALGSEEAGYFKSILAITFTNDAAGEMKQRILGALRRFARLPEGHTDPLLSDIAAELAAEGPLAHLTTAEERERVLRERAAATFRLALYHYADFAVSTIDSFVQRIVTAFTRELGLPATFEVELDSTLVLQGAVALVLDRVNRDPNADLLSRTISDFALNKAEEGKSWNNLPEELVEFGKFLLSEPVHEAMQQLQVLSLADYRRLHEGLRARQQEIEDLVRQTATLALDALAAASLQAEHLASGTGGIFGHFQNWHRWLEAPAKDASFPTATALKTLQTDVWYSGKAKTGPLRAAVDEVAPELAQTFERLQEIRQRLLPSYLLAAGMLPYVFQVSLLSELSKAVEQLSRDRNVVLIAEFNRRIAQIVLHEPVPFLYERLGDRYQHLLIDEFQDTSVLQWNNLLPLVENALGSGHLNLAVGDAKQAIYRWRGGEMEQILRLYKKETKHLYDRVPDPATRQRLADRYQTITPALEARNLNINYRSGRNIIEFNNAFFSHVSATHGALPLVQALFDADFTQQSPPGAEAAAAHVELLFTDDEAPATRYDAAHGTFTPDVLPGYLPGQTLDYAESTLYLTLQLVQQALADGYRLQDIAVLCRTRGNSRHTAKFLKERGYDIISADSLSLEFAEVVNLLVAVFRVLNRPADTLARAEALLLVDRVVRGHAPTPDRARRWAELANDKSAEPFFDELRALGYDLQENETGNLGLYELTERLLGLFGLLERAAEREYLFRFLDLTLEYSLRYGNNLNNFLAYWDQKKSSLSINAPAGRDALTITTVHKAKGLAYGVVIVPFADWSLRPFMGTLLWGRLPDVADRPVADMPGVAVLSQKHDLLLTPLAGQYTEELEKTFLEGLNMLYVAFTRPRHRLYVISKKPRPTKTSGKNDDGETGPDKPAGTVAELLHRYLVSTNQWNDEQMAYTLSETVSSSSNETPIQETAAGNRQLKPNNENPTASSQFLLTNLTSTPWEKRLKLRRHANTVFDFDEQQEQHEWNRRLHYALRRVKQAPDVERVAAQLAAEGLISLQERPALLAKLREVTADPRLAHYFSSEVAAEAEREILVGGTRKQDYKPDRIVFEAAGNGSGRRVTLLDFKLPPPEYRHRLPLQQYAALFRQLGFEQVRCVLYYFDIREVVQWEA